MRNPLNTKSCSFPEGGKCKMAGPSWESRYCCLHCKAIWITKRFKQTAWYPGYCVMQKGELANPYVSTASLFLAAKAIQSNSDQQSDSDVDKIHIYTYNGDLSHSFLVYNLYTKAYVHNTILWISRENCLVRVHGFESKYNLGSKGYFFLIDTDGSRRSRVNEARRAERKKTSGHRSYESHFHAILVSYISSKRFGGDVHVCFHWRWQLRFDRTWLCARGGGELACNLKTRPSRLNMMAFCPEHISEIYTPKRDDEHPYPFHMRSLFPPPPGLCVCDARQDKTMLYLESYTVLYTSTLSK